MKINEITWVQCFVVETDCNELNQYTRYGPDYWTVRMGESDEPVYDCAELEKAFQEFISLNGEPKKEVL